MNGWKVVTLLAAASAWRMSLQRLVSSLPVHYEDWIPQEKNRHGQWRVLGLTGDPVLQTQSAPAMVTAPGETAVTGTVLRYHGKPLVGVTVSIGSHSTVTDSAGRFLLTDLTPGMTQLKVDGTAVSNNGWHYTQHFLRVEVQQGKTTSVPNPIYLPRVDPSTEVSVSSPAAQEVVLTHPAIPGLEVHIPKGAVLREFDGKIVTKLSITPIPLDRPPYPTPAHFSVYFTLQPGGAYMEASTYGWNVRDQLISTSDGGGGFNYDAFGRRTSRTVSGTTTPYLHDGLNPATVSGSLMLEGPGLDEIYARINGSTIANYLTDFLGSTLALIDSSGASTASYQYAPYGGVAKTGTDDTPFQFTGRENDGASNLYYYRARYYSPAIGRFVSQDPMGFGGGLNFYAYAGGNPISETDPNGDCPWCVGALIGAGFDLATQLAANGGNWHCVKWGQVGLSAALGAVGGGLGGRGLTAGLRGLSNATKGSIGEGLSYVENTLAGSTNLGTQVGIDGLTTIADSQWQSLLGKIYYVESKFGTSGLTTAQRAAAAALGDAYQVERWTYPFFGRVGGYAGGTAIGAMFGSNASGGNSGCGCN